MISFREEFCVNCGKCISACPRGVLVPGEPTPQVTDRECMLCMHCAAACGQGAVVFDRIERPALPDGGEAGLAGLVRRRRSFRHYRKREPDREVIASALETAAWAPSARNRKTNGWSVIYGRKAVARILDIAWQYPEMPQVQAAREVLERGRNLVTMDAPVAILGHCAKPPEGNSSDAIIAMTQVDLLLSEAGLATCWGGYLAALVDGVDHLRGYAGVPEGNRVVCALLTGYPKGEEYLNIPHRPRPDVSWVGEGL